MGPSKGCSDIVHNAVPEEIARGQHHDVFKIASIGDSRERRERHERGHVIRHRIITDLSFLFEDAYNSKANPIELDFAAKSGQSAEKFVSQVLANDRYPPPMQNVLFGKVSTAGQNGAANALE